MRLYRLLPALLLTSPVAAQKLVTDATYSIRMTAQRTDDRGISGAAERYNVAASFGYMKELSPKFSIGGIGTVGNWGEFYFGVGPRLSFHASSSTTLNLTPNLLVYRAGEAGNSKFMLDLSMMHGDQIGISLQATSFRQLYFQSNPFDPPISAKKTMVYGGLRLGQKPGRYGIAADASALMAFFITFSIICRSGGCD